MTETQIKEYLNKYSLTTKESLVKHIEQLKRNTKPNLELISQLNYVLVDEENLFFNVFCGEKEVKADWFDLIGANMKRGKVFTYKSPQTKVSPHFLDEVLEDLEDKEKRNYWGIREIKKDSNVNSIEEKTTKIKSEDFPEYTTTTITLKTTPEQREKINEIIKEFNKNSAKEIKTEENTTGHSTRLKANTPMEGIKETQSVKKAPVFTYCKVNKNALEALSLRALHGHNIYEKGDDWENFTRVPNGDFEYSNSQFRHALDIGEDTEEEHLIASAWNAVARLEVYFRNKVK